LICFDADCNFQLVLGTHIVTDAVAADVRCCCNNDTRSVRWFQSVSKRSRRQQSEVQEVDSNWRC